MNYPFNLLTCSPNLLFLSHYRVVNILSLNSLGIFHAYFICDSVLCSLMMNYNERSNLRKRALKRVDTFLKSVNHEVYDHTDNLNNSPVSIPPGGIPSDCRPSDLNPTCISVSENTSSSYDCSSTGETNDESDLRSSITDWALRFGVSLIALSALLAILRVHLPFLPKDGRSLLKTKTEYNVEMIAGGSFHYFGIVNAFRNMLRSVCSHFTDGHTFNMQLNFDGIPLFKSSSVQLWPILGMFKGLSKKPVVVGLFCGTTKPKNLSDYLSHLVCELQSLRRGFVFGGKTFFVKVTSIMCDAPARAFIKGIKSHTGYYGCDKCQQKGSYVKHRMTFPENDASYRTDEAFRLGLDEEHHLTHCPLLETDIDMVTGFPHDYMHLVCLGVVRRLTDLWCGAVGPLRTRLSSIQVLGISERLVALKDFIPAEFARKPRALSERLRWKATEFRQLLLYTGPVVLKSVLPRQVYDNFMLLSVAIYILANSNYCIEMNDLAHSFLVSFVEHYGLLYGKEMVVYNIHGLVHLASDVKVHGPLDSISGFPYENYLGELKRLVRKPHNPLAQIIRRLSEHEERNCYSTDEISLMCPHKNGPVPQTLTEAVHQFRQLIVDGVMLRISSKDDCIAIRGKVISVKNIIAYGGKEYVMFQEYREKEALYTYPLDSRNMGVFIVSNLSTVMHFTELTKPWQKCVRLPLGDKFAVFPLTHTS